MTPDEFLLRIGRVIRRHRETLELTQEEFAEVHEINRAHYSAIERGRQNLTLLNLARIADALRIPLSRLFREAEELDIERAMNEPHQPPRRGRPAGTRSRWRRGQVDT
ncbi:helix-turn-helix transcriptional regulator [Dokdonella sp.]|uniref:helix-turn-helix domain-containing protein n=1 Tax=Dokdonella sp. TaxID=2291710 RepID=UPI0027BADC45|nr:helix-turn-helix transcriptional regulator [Dokdonella sp.]